MEIPFIEIRRPRSFQPLDSALKNLSEYDWLILTSVNGVEALWERLQELRFKTQRLAHLKIAAIGPATRRAIEEHGIKVNVVPEEYVAESVVASLRRKVKGKRVLLARAKVARDVIPRELRKLGARVDVVEAYETVIPQVFAQTGAGGAGSSGTASRCDHVYEFLDGEKFCGVAGQRSRAGALPPHSPEPEEAFGRSEVCFHWAGYFVYSSGAWAAGGH